VDWIFRRRAEQFGLDDQLPRDRHLCTESRDYLGQAAQAVFTLLKIDVSGL
jgi:hypothetical protein